MNTARIGPAGNRLALLLACLVWAWAGLMATAAPAAAASVIQVGRSGEVARMSVAVGQSETVKASAAFGNLVVGDPEIADVAPLTSRSFYVLGRKVGRTNLSLYGADGQLVAVVDVEVTYDLAALREALRATLPRERITVRSVNGRLLLQGTVSSAPAVDRALAIARDFAPDAVTNALNVGTSQQVNLEVRFLEASRNASRDLGVNYSVAAGGIRFQPLTTALASGAAINPFGKLIADMLSGGASADIIIQALEKKGVARRLAEPNLTALSGETASFLAGGEFPVPVAQDRDTITVEFKKFGVSLAFTPTVLDNGLINLKIKPEVSELDFSRAINTSAGVQIPSLVVRRTKTTVELRDGQSLSIAGLLQNFHARSADQIPWLGDVPVLGALFRSSGFQKQETDLLVIITPRLVDPVEPGRQFVSPLDTRRPSNDPELFLHGTVEVPGDYARHVEHGVGIAGPYGHLIDLPGGSNDVVTK